MTSTPCPDCGVNIPRKHWGTCPKLARRKREQERTRRLFGLNPNYGGKK